MKYVDEFRDPVKAKKIIESINKLSKKIMMTREKPIRLMEFCGGHTHTIFRYGIAQLLPECIELIHGPGCPVCVLPKERVDECIALAKLPEVIFTTFGDAMRVPGSNGSLLQAKAQGADVRMVYSPVDALMLAKKHPNREVIFFALGFETTMPSTALTLLQAAREKITNFSLFCNHIITVPILRSILQDKTMELDGFLAPGHVAMVLGEEPFDFVATEFQRPLVITGFEPLDILHAIWMMLCQLDSGQHVIENQYRRIVKPSGSKQGLNAIDDVFELQSQATWHGIGEVDKSGVKIKPKYISYDAKAKFTIAANAKTEEPQYAQCSEVIKGAIKPWQCKQFGLTCRPEIPQGALMVSSEGACAAYYQYGDLVKLNAQRERFFKGRDHEI